MEHSIFKDKSQVPTDAELRGVLGDKYKLWMVNFWLPLFLARKFMPKGGVSEFRYRTVQPRKISLG